MHMCRDVYIQRHPDNHHSFETLFHRGGVQLAGKMRVNYIKASFKTKPPSTELIERFFVKKRGLRLSSFPEYNDRVKISLMGNHWEHVNLTGGKTLRELERFAVLYCRKLNTTLVTPVKIDSIAASTHIKKLQENCDFSVRRRLTDAGFTIKDNRRFPGCVLRNKKISEKGVCVYFRTSGAVNFCGFKKTGDLVQMYTALSEAV